MSCLLLPVTVDDPHFTKIGTVGQIDIICVSTAKAVAFLAVVAVAFIAWAIVRRSAGIGLLLSSVGIKVGIEISFQNKKNNKNPRKISLRG